MNVVDYILLAVIIAAFVNAESTVAVAADAAVPVTAAPARAVKKSESR